VGIKNVSPSPDLNTVDSVSSVAVIVSYFEGKQYILEQLRSVFSQTHSELHVFLCDDHSSNKLKFVLNSLDLSATELDRLSLSVRPQNIGCTNNFLHSLESIEQPFEYFAFSDQDDVWHPKKLERAISALSKLSKDTPALYGARTDITDFACKEELGLSPLFSKPPSFANALVQNIAGGNTMVFNKSARDLIVASSKNMEVVSHDWWCYQVVTGVGGIVIYDPEPCLKYRQHSNNLVGHNTGWLARFARMCGLLQGKFRAWNDVNLKTLMMHKSLLTKQNQCILKDFIEARRVHLVKRLFLFNRSGIYRQTFIGNVGLFVAILLNKV
jgi:glycosyltransferase involved in cell wall biosynthesis